MRLSLAAVSLVLTLGALAAADAPYAGKWKMNSAKSDFGSITVAFAQLPSGEMQFTVDGQSYKFKVDGKDYPDPFGQTSAWTAIDATSWKSVNKLNGKVVSTDTLKLSADGKSLSVETTGTKPNGDKMDDKTTYARVAGTEGLAGKWKTRNFSSSGPDVFELITTAGNGLTYKSATENMSCEAKLDGKDYPCTGPTVPPGWTVAYSKTSAGDLEATLKHDGKPMYKYTYKVSADGKSMVATGGATATTELVKMVYDRQ